MIFGGPPGEIVGVEAKREGEKLIVCATFSIDRHIAEGLLEIVETRLDEHNKIEPDKDIDWWKSMEEFMRQLKLFTEGAKQ